MHFYGESFWLIKVFSTLKDLGLSDYVKFNPKIVRGLDYYTRTVFEARDTKGEFLTIIGGGRYDNLVEIMGGEKLPGVGFASSDVILEAVLTRHNKILRISSNVTQVLVTVFDESLYRGSLKLARKLREAGINTEVYLDASVKLDKQLKYADLRGIPYVAILGPDEVQAGEVTVKNLTTGEQKRVKHEEITSFVP